MLRALETDPDIKLVAGDSSLPAICRDLPDNLYDFTNVLRAQGLTVDNEPFRWDGHEYLIAPYKALRLDGHEKEEGDTHVWECGAQIGKTVGGFLWQAFLSLWFWGNYFGYFLPDKSMAEIFSDVRFKPMIQSILSLAPLWGEDPGEVDPRKRRGADQKRVRSIGKSKVFFSYMGGKTSTESIPMLGLIFDEVRRMMEGDIERARERISHSPYPLEFDYSTAGYPDVNIDKFFKRSTRNEFYSKCKCQSGVALWEHFPNCIGEKTGINPRYRSLPKFFYVCPRCGEPIVNPRLGFRGILGDGWLEQNPGARAIGFHIPQTLSSRQTAEKLLRAFQEAADLQEFYNSKLGIAYLAKESQLVNEEILRATVNDALRWEGSGVRCSLGIDQMGGFNVFVVRQWSDRLDEQGRRKSRLLHLEWEVAEDPWARADELMEAFDVNICVADALPNVNEARRFAARWPGRAFLATYTYNATGDGVHDLVEWGDRPKQTQKQKKSAEETKNRYTVRIDRSKAIEWNLLRYVHRWKEQPHERGLVQSIKEERTGKSQVYFLAEQVFWVHLQKVAKRIKKDETTGETKVDFENVGIDPHFLHADLYAEIALSRVKESGGGSAFGEYAAEERERSKDKSHRWQTMTSSPLHKECLVCGLRVAAVDPQQAAEVAGQGECRGDQ